MKALWTPIDGCFQAHSRIMMTVMMQHPQLYIQLFYKPHKFFDMNSSVWAIWADQGQRTSRESFFSKIRNFLAWADKLGWNFGGHFGYFQPNYWHYFGTVSSLFMGKCSWIFFLQKTLVFRSKTYNSQILPK